jgi:dihydroorotase
VSPRSLSSLDWRGEATGDLLLRGAHVGDPRSDIDGERDVLVRDGRVAAIGASGSCEAPEGAEVIDAQGLTAVPGFFDPHVHLRTPGQEYKEDIETGTRAAAAGGFVGLVGMANTDPPVDEPSAISALRERAADEAAVPTGFVATVTRGMRGEELTEMMALREAGAVGFSDDGLPIRSARVMRRALQYQHLVGGTILLHQEDPELTGDGVMGEGEVSAALGLAGVPAVSESTMILRDAELCRYENARAHMQHLSARISVEAVE